MSIDMKALMDEAKGEIARRAGCPRHSFKAQASYSFGAKLTCEVCGASMRLTDISTYARGYRAAGGNLDDILPGLLPITQGGNTHQRDVGQQTLQGETPDQRGLLKARDLLSEWLETPNEGDAMVDCLLGVIREAHAALGGEQGR